MSRGPDLLGGLDDISPPHRHTTTQLLDIARAIIAGRAPHQTPKPQPKE